MSAAHGCARTAARRAGPPGVLVPVGGFLTVAAAWCRLGVARFVLLVSSRVTPDFFPCAQRSLWAPPWVAPSVVGLAARGVLFLPLSLATARPRVGRPLRDVRARRRRERWF